MVPDLRDHRAVTTVPVGGTPTPVDRGRPGSGGASLRPHPLAALVHLEPGRPSVAVGLRMAVVITVPMAVGAATGRLAEATTVCLGALNAGMADVGGIRTNRWHALLAATVLDAVAFAVGTLAGHSLAAALPVMFVVALAAGLANLFGNVAANVGFVVCVLTMVGLGTPGDGSVALERLWLAGLGGAWAVLVVLVLWPVRPFGEATRAVADCCDSLGRYVRSMSEHPRTGDPTDVSSTRVRADIASARTILVATRAERRGESSEGRRLQALLRTVRRLTDQAEGFAAARTLVQPGAETAGIRELGDRILVEMADALDRSGAAIRHIDKVPEPHSLLGPERLVEDLYERLAQARGRGDLIATEEIHVAAAALEQMVSSVSDLAGMLLAPAGSLVERRGDLEGPEGDPAPGSGAEGGRFRRWWLESTAAAERVLATLRANFTLDSVVTRHALRLATTATVGLAIGLGAHLVKGYWITLTIAVVLRPFAAATLDRAVLRVAGTVLGAALTAVLVSQVTGRLPLIVAMFVLAALAFSLTPLNYGLGVVFLTPLIITLISLSDPGGWTLAGHRIVNTLIGGALALVGGYLLWPTSNRLSIVDDLGASFEAERDLLDAALAAVGQPPEQRAYDDLEELRQRAALAVDNLTATFQQLLGEAPSRRGPVDVLWSLAETSRNLLTAAVAVVHQLHLMDRAHALPQVDAVRSSIDGALGETVPALHSGTGDFTAPAAVTSAAGSLHAVVARARSERRAQLLDGRTAPSDEAWLAQDLTVVDEAARSVARSIGDLSHELTELGQRRQR